MQGDQQFDRWASGRETVWSEHDRDISLVAFRAGFLAGTGANTKIIHELVEAATAVDDALSGVLGKATVEQRQRLTWALDAIP